MIMPMPPTPAPSPTPVPLSFSPSKGLAEDVLETVGLSQISHKPLVTLGVQFVLLVMGYWLLRALLVGILSRTIQAMADKSQHAGNVAHAIRLRTLSNIMTMLLRWTLGFIAFVSLFSLLGVNVTALLGTASIAGLAFGFGAQKLVKDVITGFFLLLEDQYIAGDYVTIGSVSGTVEEVGMRVTKIRDDEGKLNIISNGDVVQVCNHSRGPVLGTFEVGVTPATNLEEAMRVIGLALDQLPTNPDIVEVPHIMGVSGSDATKISLKIAFKVAPGKRPNAFILTLREDVLLALKNAGITLG